MKHNYIIIDDDPESVLKTQSVAAGFQNLHFVAAAGNYDDGLDLILEHEPAIVFLEINPENPSSNLSLQLINELHRYLKTVPQVIVTTRNTDFAIVALRFGVLDYCIKPIQAKELRKSLLRFEKTVPATALKKTIATEPAIIELPLLLHEVAENETVAAPVPEVASEIEIKETDTAEIPEVEVPFVIQGPSLKKEKPLIICVKSYGDYRFIEAKDICYLQADNNSTDIHLYNGEMITAFKTLKHFENVLASPFVRIHNSYIVNIDYVSRIHTGNSVCYIKNTTTKLPFSKSYKENVDSIISSITNGNYLEI